MDDDVAGTRHDNACVDLPALGDRSMKLHPSLVILPLAGLLLVAGAGAVLATPADAPAQAPAVPAAASPTPDPSAAAAPWKERTDTALEDALDGLVTDGTITADQKTKILDAVAAERTARMEQRRADRQVLRDALADGGITQAELDKLSEDHPLRQATDLMADGKITTDELRSLGRGMMGGKGGRMGGHGMGGGRWHGTAPEASPAPTSGTSG
jgi:Spy/CpxP family protein refolding chaperone